MKVLVGAIVGLLLGAAIVAGLTVAGVAKNYWPILVVAVVAGIAMSQIAAGSRAKYLKGGLAALATAISMIAGQMVAAQILSKQSDVIGPKLASATVAAETSEEGEGEAVVDVEPIVEPEVILPVTGAPSVGSVGTRSGDISTTDIAFFAVGCLIAYQLGKGSDPIAAVVEEPAEDAAADPGDAEPATDTEQA